MPIVNFDDILKTGIDEDALSTFTPGELIKNFGTLTTTGDLGEGIFAAANGVTIDNRGSIATFGDGAAGIFVFGNDVTVANRGSVTTHGSFIIALEAFSEGITVVGDRFHIANYGTVRVEGDGSTAMAGAGSDGIIINYGTIEGAASDAGIFVAAGDRSQVINRGLVHISGSFDAAVLALGDEASALNLGEIRITANTNVAMSASFAGSDVANKGVIRIAADDVAGMVGSGSDHVVSNFGLVDAHGTFCIGLNALGGGPFAGVDNEILNSGQVLMDGELAMGVAVGLRSIGFRPATGAEVTNTGEIETVGDGAAGIVLIGNAHHLTNSGRITTDGASADAGFAEFRAAGVLVSGDDVVVVNASAGVIQSKDAASAAVELNVLERLGLPAANMSSLLENSGLIKGAGLAILGGAGEETVINHGRIVGDVDLGGGADTFTFGAGGVLAGALILGGGDDLVVIENGAGKARIADLAAGAAGGDVVDVSAFFLDFDELLDSSSQKGSDVLIKLDNNDSLVLANVQLGALTAGDFWFV